MSADAQADVEALNVVIQFAADRGARQAAYAAGAARNRLTARQQRQDEEIERLHRRIEDLEEANWPWEWVIATRERERWKVAEARVQQLEDALRFYADETGYAWVDMERGTIQSKDRGARARAVLDEATQSS